MRQVGLINYDLIKDSSTNLFKNEKSIKVEKSKVIIKKTGSYWDGYKKPKIVINADPDICEVETDIDNHAQVTTNPIYSFGDISVDNGIEKEESSNEINDSNEKPKDEGKRKSNKTAIIRIAAGCAAFVIIVVIIVVVIRTKRKRVTG